MRSQILFVLISIVASASAQQLPFVPGDFWLKSQALQEWEWEVDHDLDGVSTRVEYFAGTDPFDSLSVPATSIVETEEGRVVRWNSLPGARFQLLNSTDLQLWEPLGDPEVAGPVPGEYLIGELRQREFFGVAPLEPLDSDGDGLSDREEGILGTDPTDENTDNDGVPDGLEVMRRFTDPLVFDPEGGTITGKVYLDEDLSGDLTGASPIEGTEVYLDLDFDGELDDGEPRTETGADGVYQFEDLRPGIYEVRQVLQSGETQTVPAEVTPLIPDRLPNEVVEYIHIPEGGEAGDEFRALDTPYGYAPVDDWPGGNFVIVGARIENVDPGLLLLPIGERGDLPPIGSYMRNHFLTLPNGASVTLEFEETIYDGPGPDLIMGVTSQGGSTNEPGNLFVGRTLESLVEIPWDTRASEKLQLVDLADYPEISHLRYLKLSSRTLSGPGEGGTDRGLGIVGFEAINVLPLSTSARRVEIIGTETVADQDFARYFQDLPPSVLLSTPGVGARAGESFPLQVVANDDLGIVSTSLIVNGQTLVPDEGGRADYTQLLPGKMEVLVSATDTGGQTESKDYVILVADENGILPFDPKTLPGNENSGGPRVEIFTPSSGDVPADDVDIVGTIVASEGNAVWSIQYAPITEVDPENLAAADPDYVEIATGNTNQYNAALATFPTSTLPDGIYFLRVVAQAAAGGSSTFHGQVIGVNVDPASLRPVLTIHSPLAGEEIDLVHQVNATLESARPITEWKVAYADRTMVDLSNIGADDVAWIEIANGTGTFTGQDIAAIDTSRLKNGPYILRVVAFNDLRLGRVEAVEFEVTSPFKPGRTRREFVDAEIELAGFPLELRRVYDSLDAEDSGDFGFGWSLKLADPNILETVPDTGNLIFGATPYRQGTRVYLDAPNGERVGFTFEARFKVASLLGALYEAVFIPDPGNPYQLEVPEGDAGFLNLRPDGEVRLSFIGLPWNPDLFFLSDRGGTRYTYDQREGFLGLEDLNGNAITVTPEGLTHSSGPALLFDRDSEGRIAKVTAPGDVEWIYSYSPDGDLATVSGPNGDATHSYHDTLPHYLTGVTDPYGRTGEQFIYDADGLLVAIIDEHGNREEHTWDPNALTGSITDRRGNVTQLVYNDRGNVTQSTDPLGNVTTFAYEDPRHPDLETEVKTANMRIRYDYNELGLLTDTRFGDSFFHDLRNQYNERGQIVSREHLGGDIERYVYDDLGNRVRDLQQVGNFTRTTYTHTDQGQLETVSLQDEVLTYRYDPLTGGKIQESGPFGYEVNYSFAPDGSPTGVSYPEGMEFQFAESIDGNTLTITDPLGGTVVAEIDAQGDIAFTNQEGESTSFKIDSEGNIEEQSLADGGKIVREFDEEFNLSAITLPGGQENEYTHDALNRQTGMTDANGQTATVTYNAEGMVTSRTNRNGKKIGYTYNSRGQLASETWYGDNESVVREFVYTYHNGTTRLSNVTDGANTWTLFGQALDGSVTTFIFDYEGQSTYELLYDYADFEKGLPRRVRVGDGVFSIRHSNNTRFVGGRPFLCQFSSLIDDTPKMSARYRYDRAGRVTDLERFDVVSTSSHTYPQVSRSKFTYFASGDLASIRHEDPDGNLHFPGAEHLFTRDGVGRILTETTPTETSTYAYDVNGQLISVDNANGADLSYSYDLAGNPGSATIGPDNRLLAFGDLTFTYDLEGNVSTRTDSATGEIRSYEYDHRNQLIKVSSQAGLAATAVIVAEYQYDYLGRLMSRMEGGQKTWLLPDRDSVFAEFRDGEIGVSKVYFYDLTNPERRFGEWADDGSQTWYLADQIGSVNGTLDGDGTPQDWVEYDAFGVPLTAVPADFVKHRYAGRYWSEAAQLYDNHLRHYDPVSRRFQQQDPLRYEGGDFNLYRYVGNNPISGDDPLGTSAAVEYGTMLKKVAKCVKSLKSYSDCVDELLTGVAKSIIAGKAQKINVRCAVQKPQSCQ